VLITIFQSNKNFLRFNQNLSNKIFQMDSDEDGFDYEDGEEEDLYLTEPKQILYDIVPYREWEQEPEVLLILLDVYLISRSVL